MLVAIIGGTGSNHRIIWVYLVIGLLGYWVGWLVIGLVGYWVVWLLGYYWVLVLFGCLVI